MHYVILGICVPSRGLHICDSMYRGFFDTESSPGIPNGEMKDDNGSSVIGRIVLEGNCFEFTQVREHTPEQIRYCFRREGSVWVGTYSGEKSGVGRTHCVLNPVDLRFLVG